MPSIGRLSQKDSDSFCEHRFDNRNLLDSLKEVFVYLKGIVMFHALKVSLVAILTATLFASPVLAHDKVNRSKLTREQTFKQLGKDLAELQRIVEKAAKDLATPTSDVQILCDNPTDLLSMTKVETERNYLLEQGYTVTNAFTQDIIFVGTGLVLAQGKTGVLVAATLPGSSADATEFFRKEDQFRIKAVSGVSTIGRELSDVRAMIRGESTPDTGVVITVARKQGGRDFDRFLRRTRMTLKDASYCERFEAPLKK